MKTVKGLNTLAKKFNDVQEQATQVREHLDQKRDWWESKSERWQESEDGCEWGVFIEEVETFLESIKNIELPNV